MGYNTGATNIMFPYQRYMDSLYHGQQATGPVYEQQANQTPTIVGINWVQGLEEAEKVVLQPKQMAILMDSTSDRMFIRVCDDIGKPSTRSFLLQEEIIGGSNGNNEQNDTSQFITRDELQKILFDMLGGMSNGTKGDIVSTIDAE